LWHAFDIDSDAEMLFECMVDVRRPVKPLSSSVQKEEYTQITQVNIFREVGDVNGT